MAMFSRLTRAIVVGVCITTALPILAAVLLARQQAVEIERRFALDLANTVLAQADATGDQLRVAARAVNDLGPGRACSPAGLDVMRELDLSSTLLQGVAWVEGEEIACSSFAGVRAFPLGKPDFASSRGASYRTRVTLIDPQRRFVAIQTGRSVGILHQDLSLRFVDKAPGLAVGVFSWSRRKPIILRGDVPKALIEGGFTGSTVFSSGGRTVAIVRSRKYDTGAIAILPGGRLSGHVNGMAVILLPVALLVGLALSLALIRLLQSMASMPAMIRTGLKRGEFKLVYQPVMELGSGRIAGVEALLRWDRGKGEAVSPDEFIPAAEEAGIISQVTDRVFELLAEDARRILRTAPRMQFALNVSAADMHRPGMVDEVTRLADRSGIAFDQLTFEVTETSLVDVQRARDILRALRAEGVKMAIDDFGTGYSSLAYLAELEIDFVKIDKLFVQALATESATSQVAVRIIEMAKDLDLALIGEGVETEAQAILLKDLGVEFAQGFHFSRPLGLADLLQLLRAGGATGPA